MPYYRKFVGDKCYLSPCQLTDAARWAEWFNDLEVSLPLGDEAYHTISPEQQEKELRDALEHGEPIFSIVDSATDRLIGRCLLFAVNRVDRSAMLGIVIGEKEYWGQGYGQEATRLLLDYAFDLLNLNSVMLGAFSFNERAIQAYKKVGFREIGRRRQARIIGGKKYDVVLMDILAEEYWALHGEGGVSPKSSCYRRSDLDRAHE